MDFLSLMKNQSQLDNDSSTNFQKSPTFNQRMKQPTGSFIKQGVAAEEMQVKKTVPLSIIAVEFDNSQVSAMEEDDSSIAADRARPGTTAALLNRNRMHLPTGERKELGQPSTKEYRTLPV
ncbi:hypothetical protein RND71_026583 [Anisodus tanguticus]|uniref:Uncharacterized protein n=1 Tax=Anisodus tanguticus TaxID=243964 RepID=A0AAE1RL29_9SOLA|nr:hypothetical protein RND71_026583 [Anisodus tanguticus]